MLLYITVDDVFPSDSPQRRGARPLHTIPATVAGLYDLGLRHHLRGVVMKWWTDGSLEAVPDWKLDRLAIRTALFSRERLGLEPGQRVAVFGRLGSAWPIVDFAAMGFGLTPVGLEHDVPDDELVAALTAATARVAFATDPASAERLLSLRRTGRLAGTTVVAAGIAEQEGQVPLETLLDQGGTLDTAERAQSFRAFSRQITPEAEALWHAGRGGRVVLTHRQAMAAISAQLRERPARDGDVAYLEGPRVTLQVRLSIAAFVGDGRTTIALGREEQAAEDVATLSPHKALVSGSWLATACRDRGPRWPLGLDRARVGRRLREGLGGRLRWVEVDSPVDVQTAAALSAAGVLLEVRDGSPGVPDSVN
jgi:AMP-binding enzyme